jgi:predicted transcriptional regulator
MTLLLNDKTPKRRDKIVIMAEIMSIARKGTSKTHVMFKANLSFSQLNEYIEILLQANLLEKSVIEGKELYTTTKKGQEFMQKACEAIQLLNQDLRNNRVKTFLPVSMFTQRNGTFVESDVYFE